MRKVNSTWLAHLLLCAILFGVPAFAQPSLTPHSAQYKVKISVMGGQLNTELRQTESGYVATHVIKPTGMSRMFSRGSISETSEFYATDDGVRPDKYRSDDTVSRNKERVDIQFDWSTGEARGTVNDVYITSVMNEIAHDRVSIQYELMHDLLNRGPSAEYILFDVDRLKTLNVRSIGSKTIKVPAGKYEAVGIQHQATGSKRITTLWCVEELDFLPVIIEQHRKGKLRVRAVLTKYTPGPRSKTIRLER
jgi:hypothetical protein